MVEFYGLLTNVGKSILQIDFGSNFKILEKTIDEAKEIIKKTEKKSYINLLQDGLDWGNRVYYFFVNAFEGEKAIIYGTRYKKFSEMVLADSEITTVNAFLMEETTYNQYVQNAFDWYDLSYTLESNELAFVCLITSLECLFSPLDSKSEITYRLSRYAAIVIEENYESRAALFKDMKKYYSLRSSILHGTKNQVSDVDLKKIRNYCRIAIKKLIALKQKKDDLHKQLDRSGFEVGLSNCDLKTEDWK
ncbi:hypothetical protein HZC08_01090 [Candidatus Micrarchaeota archaeon]|nr:hypothetical protein [Candidatus Micrarchaeota archaeon]